MAAAAPRKLRVLCLHGYAQSAQQFRQKTGSLRSESKKVAEWMFAAAPHALNAEQLQARREQTGRAVPEGQAAVPEEELFSWWRYDRADDTYDSATLDASVAALADIYQTDGPFDGVLGFSQGAAMALILAARQQQGTLPAALQGRVGFVALFSGFLPHDEAMAAEIVAIGELSSESFHSFGEQDAIIPTDMSRRAVGCFGANAVVVTHAGGHLVSSERPVRKGFKAFLQERRAEIVAEEGLAAVSV